MPNSSSFRAMRSLSSREKLTPSAWEASRRVVSDISIRVDMCFLSEGSNRTHQGADGPGRILDYCHVAITTHVSGFPYDLSSQPFRVFYALGQVLYVDVNQPLRRNVCVFALSVADADFCFSGRGRIHAEVAVS